jgi:hypothetical protein
MHGRPILRNSRGLPLFPTELFMASELSVPSPPNSQKSVLQQLTSFLFLSRNALLSFLTAPCVFFRSYPKPDILRNNAGKKKKQKRRKRKFQKNVREQTMNLARHRCAFSSCVNFSSFFKFVVVVVVVVLAHLLHSEKKMTPGRRAVRASTSI